MNDEHPPAIPSLAAIRAALAGCGASPRKSFGQHFLSDPGVLRRIVDFAEIVPDDPVLEVGPGPGVLTAEILRRGARVVAIEADPQMIEVHHTLIGHHPNLEIVAGDALEERPAPALRVREKLAPSSAGRRYSFIANLPYSIASPLIVDVCESFPPRVAVLMVQREVAQRMRARPGDAEYGALSVLVQLVASVEECMRLKPGAFWPPPKVDSAVLRLVPLERALRDARSLDALHGTVRRAFAERRKKLKNTLLRDSSLDSASMARVLGEHGFDPESRAEELAPPDFLRLSAALSSVEQPTDEPGRDVKRKGSGRLHKPPESL